jgi:hypothetical protein
MISTFSQSFDRDLESGKLKPEQKMNFDFIYLWFVRGGEG